MRIQENPGAIGTVIVTSTSTKNYKSYYSICINPQKVTNVEFYKTRHSFTKRKLQKASIALVVNSIVVQPEPSISSINSCKSVALSLSAVSVLLTLTRKLKRRANEHQMVGGDQNHLLIVSHFTQCDP